MGMAEDVRRLFTNDYTHDRFRGPRAADMPPAARRDRRDSIGRLVAWAC
jgi:hypothetical protein